MQARDVTPNLEISDRSHYILQYTVVVCMKVVLG